jgi:hypothetical protein
MRLTAERVAICKSGVRRLAACLGPLLGSKARDALVPASENERSCDVLKSLAKGVAAYL